MLLRRDRALTAVAIMLDIAFHAGRTGELVSGADVAERMGAARRGVEPVFQALSRAGLLDSVRGPRGGYRLGRRPRELRLSDIVACVREDAEPSAELTGRLQAAVVMPLWREMDAELRNRLAGVTIEDLLKRAQAAGLRRAAVEPLNFAI
ncbi:Rrf2 family transcriptional regulator [Roseomonas terrae]|jgi:Rrf2 family iron-sulfur cluster assembly transcriptional regulator|uniref:Rrf2 family transcriptional regulator n=1 Tax=Neoroseomonas terrae TaxID=424799 RepID=A0ABS5ECX2_9PROT|nr:Rrf2 family transcriptional regulator [Neoroseomonas terrae]MBR0648872.1 Rrf2 family transcriptional regulator [Neoroseomonas terrae]